MALIVLGILSDKSGLLWQGELKAIDPATGLLQCQYTSDIATGLAAGALIFLILAQSFIMIVTRCLCCGSGYKPGAARTFGVLMFIISWWVLLSNVSVGFSEKCSFINAVLNWWISFWRRFRRFWQWPMQIIIHGLGWSVSHPFDYLRHVICFLVS